MNSPQADELGQCIAKLVQGKQPQKAYALLAPVLAERTPFRLLDRLGKLIGAAPIPPVSLFLNQIAAEKTMGGWVVIASALSQQLDRDLAGAFARCHSFIIAGDVWYATDILGERVPGPALLLDFPCTLDALDPWREDENRWIRRTVGIAVHFWAKRSRGADEFIPQAKALLNFLEPMFEEKNIDTIKGVGWGIETLGKYYPELVTTWLSRQVSKRQPRALMLRKALTKLSKERRERVTENVR